MTFTMRRFLAAFLLICVVLSPHSPVSGQSRDEDDSEQLETKVKPASTSVATEEAAGIIVTKTNSFRQEHGKDPVKVDSNVGKAAQYFANYMARTDDYGHRADGKRPSERAEAHGYNYCLVAENIAYQFSSAGFETEELANRFVEGWKTSPPHRENMLDADVRDTGVAVAQSESTGYWYAVQMFGRPKSAAIEFKIANESDTTLQYSIKDRSFELPPRYTRTHLRCRPSNIDFQFGHQQKVQASDGSLYEVVQVSGKPNLQLRKSQSP